MAFNIRMGVPEMEALWNDISGRKRQGQLAGDEETSHFEGRVASSALEAAQGLDEYPQREHTTFDFNFGGQWLVAAADRA